MKIVVITGASAGIGLQTAQLFADNGFKVYNLSRKSADGIESLETDVTSRDNVFRSVNEVVRREGRIDVLINSAGMGISGAIEDTDDAAARKIFDVNYFGTLYAAQAVVPVMRKNDGGTIINLSSAAASLPIPFQGFYSSTKAAVSSLTEALRLEVKPFNIKVTSILPGDVKTEFTARREKNVFNNPDYKTRIEKSVAKMEHDEQNGMPPLVIAKIALRLANAKNPPPYVTGGVQYKLLIGLARFLPKRLVLYVIGKLYA